MVFARRTAALRLTAMAALAASAVLISDGLHPDRAFCPLEQACEAAGASALGTFFGVSTSVLGAAAFGGLFFLTLLPVEWGRRLLQLAGFLAAVAGAGFIVYQAVVLRTFCPLCLVADGAGLLAGLITLTWPAPPIRVSGRRLPGEGATSRLAWTFAGVLAMAAPFAWPRAEEPAWVEIPDQAVMDFENEGGPGGEETEPPVYGSAHVAPETPTAPTAYVSTTRWNLPKGRATGGAATGPAPRRAPVESPATQPAPTSPPEAPDPADAPQTTQPTPASEGPPPAPAQAPPRPRKRGPVIVEYLNAYCGHCRATHKRLEKVLDEMGVQIRRHRVYAWASKDYPLWVRACSYAKHQGVEERLFQELMNAPDQSPGSIYAAARRAGLDVIALQCAVEDPDVPEELVRDCKRMQSAGLKGLPTLDIGRRRLLGEQSEAELRDAIRAALEQARAQ